MNEFPWAAFIKIGSDNFCGGTLVNSKYVVTAAHCIDDKFLSPTSVTVTLETFLTLQSHSFIEIPLIL